MFLVSGLILTFLLPQTAQAAKGLTFKVHNHSRNNLVKWSMDFRFAAGKGPVDFNVTRLDKKTKQYVNEKAGWKWNDPKIKEGKYHVEITINGAAAVPKCTWMKFTVYFNCDHTSDGYNGCNLEYAPEPCPKKAVKKAEVEDTGNFVTEIDNAVFYGGDSGRFVPELNLNVPADTYAYLYQVNNTEGPNSIIEFRIPDINDPYDYPDIEEGLFNPYVMTTTHDGQATVIYESNDANSETPAISVADFNGLGAAGINPIYWGPQGNDYVAYFTGLQPGQSSNILVAYSMMGPAVQQHGTNMLVSGGGNSADGLVWLPGPSPGDWTKVELLVPQDVNVGDDFGCSASISGYYAIIGAMNDDDLFPTCGSAYIFRKDLTQVVDPNWIEQQKLTPSDPDYNINFGTSVDIYGDYAIVGAPYVDDVGNNPVGAAYVFKNINENWTQIQKLNPISPNQYDDFGCSVAICGKLAVAGAKCDDTMAQDAGAVYVFAANDIEPNNWSFVQKLYASDANAFDNFGSSVDICCNTIIVGAPWSDANGISSGAAYIFETSDEGQTWSQTCKLPFPAECNEYDNFGIAVSISSALQADRFAIVGAPHADGTADGPGSGLAFIYAPNDTDPNNWDKQATLIGSDSKKYDYFGSTVSIHGRRAIVGAYHHYMDETGAAYVFEHYDPNWSQVARLSPQQNSKFGYSVAVNRNYAVVGAPGHDVGGGAYMHKRISSVADLDGDFFVDFSDYAILVSHYMEQLGQPGWRNPIDISEKIDDVIDLKDLCALAQDWLGTISYP